ncbi:MAG: sulfotransferase domain-containing protein [Rhizobiales bacterium]|nr:sulfotransferase domain-containing protein [Hyphomicrobiales bacterium]
MAELNQQFAASTTAACRSHVAELNVRADDVIISTYPKCGTTWMQQIVHGLRSHGDMTFGEISEVIPFMEVAYDCGIDLNGPQGYSPRAFKTHMSADELPEGARYIVVLRDPMDACVSFFNFMNGWYMEPGAVSLDTFTKEYFLALSGGDRYWTHLCSWWKRRHEPNVRIFCFEDIKQDPAACVRIVAQFIDIELDDQLEQLVLEQSSIEFMLRHKHQFDDNLLRRARDAAIGLPPDGESSKVKSGKVGASKPLLSEHMAARFDEIWREEVTPLTGAKCYRDLRSLR